MIFGVDWRVVASIVLILVILWMFAVPSETQRKRRKELQEQLKRKRARTGPGPLTYPKLIITGITARRGDTTTLITNMTGKTTLDFNGIASGNYSETIYVRLSGDGAVTQFNAEASARSTYERGDYGLLAITMSPGVVTQRNIIPENLPFGVEPFQLEFSVMVNAK